MGVAIAIPHTHMWLIMLLRVLGDHTPNFGLTGHLVSFGQPEPLSMGVAMIKPHPHVVNNAHSITWKPHTKFQLGWSFHYLLIAKITSGGCGYDQTAPTCD